MNTDSIRVLGVSGSLRRGSFNTSLLRAAVAIAEAEAAAPVRHRRHPRDPAVRRGPPHRGHSRAGQKLGSRSRRPTPSSSSRPSTTTPCRASSRTRSTGPPVPPCRVRRQAVRRHGRERRHERNDARAVSPPADRRVPRHARAQQAGGVRRNAKDAFDADGTLKDETARKRIAQQLAGLVAWTRRLARKRRSKARSDVTRRRGPGLFVAQA